MLNKGMHKPSPLFYMDIVVQFIFLFISFYISINNTNILWLGWFHFHQPIYFNFFYVFVCFSWNPNMHCVKAFIPNNRERFKNTENTWHWNVTFFSFSSSFNHFSLYARNGNTMQQTMKNCIRFCFAMKTIFSIWIKKGERQNQIFKKKKNVIEIE